MLVARTVEAALPQLFPDQREAAHPFVPLPSLLPVFNSTIINAIKEADQLPFGQMFVLGDDLAEGGGYDIRPEFSHQVPQYGVIVFTVNPQNRGSFAELA